MTDKLDVMKNVPCGWGRKCWDIPRSVTICVPVEQLQKSMNVPRSVPSGGQIEGQQKDGISQRMSQFVCQLWVVESRVAPRNIYAALRPDVTRSVTGFGRNSGNRHFANRISPLKINH